MLSTNRISIFLPLISVLLSLTQPPLCRAQSDNADLRPAQAALRRLLPSLFSQITLSPLQRAHGRDTFRITGTAGHIRIAATTNSAALFGVNWYLKYVAHLQLSTNGDQLALRGLLPAPADAIEHSALYPYRYALNQNSDGYSTPYWGWLRWQREIDLLAASGINAMLIERGMDTVLYRTFRDFGYSDTAIRNWITQPAHQNWQLMGNMCCFNGPISRALLAKRARSAKRIVARLRELGITPVLPGYYGMVPADFAERHPEAHIIAQGNWNGFARPSWLDPRDPLFTKVAASFYRHEREIFGDTSIYDMEIFQEGGTAGNVPVAAAAQRIQQSLNNAHPDAMWMLLGWQRNPSPELIFGADRSHLLIIDLDQGRSPREKRESDFGGARYLFGGLWAFGGRTTLGANLYDYAVRLPAMGIREGSRMAGTAVFPEGLDTNPVVFDLFTEMAWRTKAVDLPSWIAAYATRRYGGYDAHAQKAWKILMQTAYGQHADGILGHGERDAAPESLLDAQPSLTAQTASSWSPDALRYDPAQFNGALAELLQVKAPLQTSDTYRYDLVDVGRQALANWSRQTLPQIKDAFDRGDCSRFHALTSRWLSIMDVEDRLLATNRYFLLGPWLGATAPWAESSRERAQLEYDARSILTTWGDRQASESGLHDYGNKDWSGLTHDFYRMRWQVFFADLGHSLESGTPPKPIDWFALGDAWNRRARQYPVHPVGNSHAIAEQIGKELEISISGR
ncbi:MAG: alpha-N-acetylglucosaminidase [Terracidiphilus sp.]|jgi:alpha-N-acetylglucosaminidase